MFASVPKVPDGLKRTRVELTKQVPLLLSNGSFEVIHSFGSCWTVVIRDYIFVYFGWLEKDFDNMLRVLIVSEGVEGGDTFASFGPTGDVCQQMAKYAISFENS